MPETVAGTLTPSSIQFRGSAGKQRILIGTPNFDANTFVVDLTTGERQAVVGLLGAEKPPVSIQNAAISADDRHLLAWDGRTTWIVDLDSKVSRVLGSGQFTFSAEFSNDGSQLVYSQQMADGSTHLLLQDTNGLNERMLGQSATGILVSLWIPSRSVLLLDERTSAGGKLAVFDPATSNRQNVLDYTGATNIVQLSPDGKYALAGIEGGQGRDWYQMELSLVRPSSRLLDGLTDAVILPGFDFHAAWALALPPASTGEPTAVKSIDLATGNVTTLIPNITSDAAVERRSGRAEWQCRPAHDRQLHRTGRPLPAPRDAEGHPGRPDEGWLRRDLARWHRLRGRARPEYRRHGHGRLRRDRRRGRHLPRPSPCLDLTRNSRAFT